jgi:predicted FMN-binding regulatory protein PaiB
LEGKFKLSQNHPVEDRKRVVAALETSDHDGKLMADLMKSIVL